jgi:hypothetical protein
MRGRGRRCAKSKARVDAIPRLTNLLINKAGDRFQKETSFHRGNIVCKGRETVVANLLLFFSMICVPQKS